jgi:histidinol-phosphatase (PHP family)
MLTNFHTHTTFCDGKSAPEEVVVAAIEKGFAAIGFSGHGFTPFSPGYCMAEGAADYIASIKDLKAQYKDKIQIYLGAEEDAFSPVERSDFEYIIGSSHYLYANGKYIPIDSGPECFRACVDACNGDVLAFAEQYYKAFCDYILERKPDIIGHFDLITKYDELNKGLLLNDPAYLEIAEKYLRKAMESDGIFEVNTGAISRGYRTTPYPCRQLLELLRKQDCKIMLNSDSHHADTLDCHFAETKTLLRELGFRYTWILTDKGFESCRL